MSVKMIVTFGSALDFLLNATRLETEKKKKKNNLTKLEFTPQGVLPIMTYAGEAPP